MLQKERHVLRRKLHHHGSNSQQQHDFKDSECTARRNQNVSQNPLNETRRISLHAVQLTRARIGYSKAQVCTRTGTQ